MKLAHSFIKLSLIAGLLISAVSHFADDEVRKSFFRDADAALIIADKESANVLSPKKYQRAMQAYQDAESGLERGRNIKYVRDKTATATQDFRDAAKGAKLAKTVLGQVLKSRQDARNALASKLSPDQWVKAESEFSSAINYLERGDLKRAKAKNIEATNLYRDAELSALKTQYLNDTRTFIAKAEQAKVNRYAPISLQKSKDLLSEAEKELSENRYDADRPRSLAIQANYEAKHSLYLSEIVRSVKDRKLSVEELILQWEEPLAEIASAADISPALSNGPEKLQNDLVEYIELLRNKNQQQEQAIDASSLRIADMEKEIETLDERLGGATEERIALAERLEAQARVKEKFDKIEKMFTRTEARVFREGDNIILRLVALSFDSGDSQLSPEGFSLLEKVRQAIYLFPNSKLTIEGHTDSHGGDDSNQLLSQARAEAVQLHMINSLRIESNRLIATGYGETNPVANNETASGRAKNRRIDIIIEPNLGSQ